MVNATAAARDEVTPAGDGEIVTAGAEVKPYPSSFRKICCKAPWLAKESTTARAVDPMPARTTVVTSPSVVILSSIKSTFVSTYSSS